MGGACGIYCQYHTTTEVMKKFLLSMTMALAFLPNAFSFDFTEVDSLLNAAIGNGVVPGAVLCVSKGNEIIYTKSYGNRQIVPVKGQNLDLVLPIKMTDDTVFDMASCTKVACTTIAVLQLWEKRKLKLDAPVGKYLKPFRGQDLKVM